MLSHNMDWLNKWAFAVGSGKAWGWVVLMLACVATYLGTIGLLEALTSR